MMTSAFTDVVSALLVVREGRTKKEWKGKGREDRKRMVSRGKFAASPLFRPGFAPD
jgi:hypothetical protein